MEEYNEERRYEFFSILKEKLEDIRAAAEELELRDEFAMFFIGGLYKNTPPDSDNNIPLQAMADFHLSSEEELDEILSIGVDLYQRLEGDRLSEGHNPSIDTEGWGVNEWMKYIEKNTDPNEPKN